MSLPDKTEARLYGVIADSKEFEKVWQEVLPFLNKTLGYADGKYLAEDVYKAIKSRDMQLWVAYTDEGLISFCVSQIIIFPQQKRLSLPFVGGINLFKWLHFFEPIAQWAKKNGCTTVEGYARPGWEKVLARYGFKKIYSIIKAEL